MNRSLEELQAFIDEVKAVCDTHGLLLVGTCGCESIYGEITIVESTLEGTGWERVEEQVDNRVSPNTNGVWTSDPTLHGIGTVKD